MNDRMEVPEEVRRGGDVERPLRAIPFSKKLDAFSGPPGPAVGLRVLAGMRHSGQRYLSKLSARYGPVFRAPLGFEPSLMVSHPDHVQTMLRNPDGAWSTGLAWRSFFRDLDTGGLLYYGGDLHREARRLLQPAFSPSAIAGYLRSASEVYDQAIEGWLSQGRVSFGAACRRMFADVSARIFLGFEEPAAVARLDKAMNDAWQAVLTVRKEHRLSPGWRRASQGMRSVRSLLTAPSTGGTTLHARVMGARDEADWLDSLEVRRGLFMGVMFGAFDTTSSGVASMAYLLARHPDWQDRVREECSGLGLQRPEPDALKSLVELGWVWRESLRLYPVAGVLPRVTLRETSLGPHVIPAATLVFALTGAVMNDPHWWTDPDRFDPERFEPGRAEDRRHRSLYLPFGGGAHACIGAALATAEALAFFHALLRRARITLARPGSVRHQYTPIGQIADPIHLRVDPL